MFIKLVDSVQFYLGFEIADQSGIALTEGTQALWRGGEYSEIV